MTIVIGIAHGVGSLFFVEARPQDTLSQLKKIIEAVEGTPIANQRLSFKGSALPDDSKTLKSCEIHDKSTLFLRRSCYIIVRHSTGSNISSFQFQSVVKESSNAVSKRKNFYSTKKSLLMSK